MVYRYTCHSGGASGADSVWENICKEYGIETIPYSFNGHNQNSLNPIVLTESQLVEGFEQVIKASISLKRNINNISSYVKKLLSRNWFQVKNSDAIYAIGTIKNNQVNGGTGWAVQMAIDTSKPVFVFEQVENLWYQYDYNKKAFIPMYDKIPVLTEQFAGIGTREINENGILAIKNILKINLKNE
jgi:hypothetical protein